MNQWVLFPEQNIVGKNWNPSQKLTTLYVTSAATGLSAPFLLSGAIADWDWRSAQS